MVLPLPCDIACISPAHLGAQPFSAHASLIPFGLYTLPVAGLIVIVLRALSPATGGYPLREAGTSRLPGALPVLSHDPGSRKCCPGRGDHADPGGDQPEEGHHIRPEQHALGRRCGLHHSSRQHGGRTVVS